MMETKLCFALCALLLINLASAEHDNDNNGTASTANTGTATAQGAPSLDATSQPAPALNTDSSSRGTNVTKEANILLTANNKMEPAAPSVEGQATTSGILLSPTTASPSHTADPVTVNTTNTTLPTHAPASISQQPAQPSANPNATTSQTEPPKPETSPAANTSTGSPPGSSTTTATTFSPSNLTKVHANTPSQLNVGGDTTMVHESTTLNPLLAGLVSAFIITAVIILVLLFLKLRRRRSRPEFHRLQDLPMDDMMEDAPLSMYSY